MVLPEGARSLLGEKSYISPEARGKEAKRGEGGWDADGTPSANSVCFLLPTFVFLVCVGYVGEAPSILFSAGVTLGNERRERSRRKERLKLAKKQSKCGTRRERRRRRRERKGHSLNCGNGFLLFFFFFFPKLPIAKLCPTAGGRKTLTHKSCSAIISQLRFMNPLPPPLLLCASNKKGSGQVVTTVPTLEYREQ